MIEGASCEDWMVLDLGRIVVHSFTPAARQKYDLEGLWNAIADPPKLSTATADTGINEDEKSRILLSSVEKSWAGRPKSIVKTKQLESADFMTEDEFVRRVNSAEVVRSF